MTLDELLALARETATNEYQTAAACTLARAILDLFPSDAGCGAAEPRVMFAHVYIPDEWPGAYTAAEARGLIRVQSRRWPTRRCTLSHSSRSSATATSGGAARPCAATSKPHNASRKARGHDEAHR